MTGDAGGAATDGSAILSFLGATGTVTGSRFLVETGHARLLVEAGLFQGLKRLRLRNREPFPVDPASVDAIVVTHAHLDHVGYVPALVAAGFTGEIHCTERTAQLGAIVLADAARLQEEEAEYANRRGFSKHHPAEPLYTEADAREAIARFRPHEFGVPFESVPGTCATFRRAGHILGSAGVLVEADTAGASAARSVFVTGDVGRPVHPLLLPPEPPPEADAFVVESTYGNREHADVEGSIDLLASAITRTARRGGVVVIPAFAVDRTELVLLALRDLAVEGRIPRIPVYADSPMALAVLDVYRAALRTRDPDVRRIDVLDDPFGREHVREAHTRDESIALNERHGPAIIISASGMATGGRVLHHLARLLPDQRNCVVLVGYQAEGTRGRLLANKVPAVKMLGRYVPVRAEIVVADGFSAHADGDELVSWLRAAPRAPDTAFVVHGEPEAADALRARLDRDLGWNAVVPHDGERVRIGA